jgi:Fic family protein
MTVGRIHRAGRYVRQPAGYRAFIPSTLPPKPPIAMDDEMWALLSEADRALGRLDGASELLPNPDLFVSMHVRREAVLSSQIEGTQASLVDLLEFEAERASGRVPSDVAEVSNHVSAMNYGLKRLEELPLSLRLIREIHGILLRGVRGGERAPGEFRDSQNWIGAGRTPSEATYVPPPPAEMRAALDDFERFLHDESPTHSSRRSTPSSTGMGALDAC